MAPTPHTPAPTPGDERIRKRSRGLARWLAWIVGASCALIVVAAVLQATLDTTKKGEPAATGERASGAAAPPR